MNIMFRRKDRGRIVSREHSNESNSLSLGELELGGDLDDNGSDNILIVPNNTRGEQEDCRIVSRISPYTTTTTTITTTTIVTETTSTMKPPESNNASSLSTNDSVTSSPNKKMEKKKKVKRFQFYGNRKERRNAFMNNSMDTTSNDDDDDNNNNNGVKGNDDDGNSSTNILHGSTSETITRCSQDMTEALSSSSPILSSSPSSCHSSLHSSMNDIGTTALRIVVPEGLKPGDVFKVNANGRVAHVRLPSGVEAGQTIQIRTSSTTFSELPSSLHTDASSIHSRQSRHSTGSSHMMQRSVMTEGEQEDDDNETVETATVYCSYEAMVPKGVVPGTRFAIRVNGIRVLIQCPRSAKPGQLIRFKIPKLLTGGSQQNHNHHDPTNGIAALKLSYDVKDGWVRTIRVSDYKFQWIRMNENGNVDNSFMMKRQNNASLFDPDKSAYVRRIRYTNTTTNNISNQYKNNNNHDRYLEGTLSFVPAMDEYVDSCVKRYNIDTGIDEVIVSCNDIVEAQTKSFEEKSNWFYDQCKLLRIEYTVGHVLINVRRDHILADSVDAIMSLKSRNDLYKTWLFKFVDEPGLDAGGVTREWYQLVTSAMFNPEYGFWISSNTNQMMMMINSGSKLLYEDYLRYYRFMGRVIGKALFDKNLVSSHMVHYIYKHILGWPITLNDLESIDSVSYKHLKGLQSMVQDGVDILSFGLDFTKTEFCMGAKISVDLIPNGSHVYLHNDNLAQYLEACLKYRMMEYDKPQLCELLLGFYDVIPEPLLTVFDFQELELFMCGLPEINIDDWKSNTIYTGDYEFVQNNDNDDDTDQQRKQQPFVLPDSCMWFWDIVEHEFDQEMKARLLQFVTGTSGVPSGGFGVLHGSDGDIRKFTINGISYNRHSLPRAHTCFNRLDLPNYVTKDELREKLIYSVTLFATGFDMQ